MYTRNNREKNLVKEILKTLDSKKELILQKINSFLLSTSFTAPGMADFKVVEDPDENLYVVWTEPTADENGEYTGQEVYATALITEYDENEAEESGVGANWANPYRLTHSGLYNDEIALAVDGSGNMMVVHNQFKQTLTGEDDNPLEISDLKLMATYMEPCGSMEIKDVQLSDSFPQADEDITVTVTLENNGLSSPKKPLLLRLYFFATLSALSHTLVIFLAFLALFVAFIALTV